MGSLTVMNCKGLGIALKQTFQGDSQLSNPLTWFIILTMIICITTQLNYMNKALDLNNTAVVTLILYVIFTTCVILVSAILFKELSHLSMKDIIGNICGFLIVVCGVYLMQAFKDVDVSMLRLAKPQKDKSSGKLLDDSNYSYMHGSV